MGKGREWYVRIRRSVVNGIEPLMVLIHQCALKQAEMDLILHQQSNQNNEQHFEPSFQRNDKPNCNRQFHMQDEHSDTLFHHIPPYR